MNYNQAPAPAGTGTATKQCTHRQQYSDFNTIVEYCETLEKTVCSTTPQCEVLLMPGEVEPSVAMEMCTHTNKYNFDTNVVQMCQAQVNKLGCATTNVEPATASTAVATTTTTASTPDVKCVWNECYNTATGSGCPSTESTCGQMNGPTYPGVCMNTLTPPAPSTEPNVCTHREDWKYLNVLVNECKEQ